MWVGLTLNLGLIMHVNTAVGLCFFYVSMLLASDPLQPLVSCVKYSDADTALTSHLDAQFHFPQDSKVNGEKFLDWKQTVHYVYEVTNLISIKKKQSTNE